MPLRSIKRVLVYSTLWLITLAAAGCDMSMPTPSSSGGEVRTEKLKTNLSVDEARNLAQPAGATPGLSVDIQNAQNMGLAGDGGEGSYGAARGLTMRLFDTSVSGDDERFERLESAVQKLRDDFDAVSPSINRLVAIEREIQGLVDQLQVLVQQDNSASTQNVPPIPESLVDDNQSEDLVDSAQPVPDPLPPMPLAGAPATTTPETQPIQAQEAAIPETAAPEAAAPAAPKSAPAPKTTYANQASLSLARAADHAGKTRLVFEMDKALPYKAEINGQNYLILTFDNASLNKDFTDRLGASSLVAGAATVEEDSSGYVVIVPLKRASKILSQGVLKPDAQSKTYRVYLDLAL